MKRKVKRLPIIEVTLDDLKSKANAGYDSECSSVLTEQSDTEDGNQGPIFSLPSLNRITYTKLGRVRQRQRPPTQGKRYKIESNLEKIKQDIASGCCKKRCIGKFTIVNIKNLRQDFYSKSCRSQKEFIVNQLRSTLVNDQPRKNIALAVQGNAVCEKAWCKIHGVKKSRYSLVKSKVKIYDEALYEDPRSGQLYPTKKFFGAHRFISQYVVDFGDNQPDTPDIHLPSCVTKADVYKDYVLECQVFDRQHLKIGRFYEIWKSDFQHVKIRKCQTFTQCIECTNFRTSLLKKTNKEEKRKIMEMRKAHLNLQRLCRQKYYKHNTKASEEPDQYLSVIIDGMDQSKSNLPRFYSVTKADCTLSKMHHHITGVLCQSSQLHSYAFTWTDKFSGDADITLNCLTRVLSDISRMRNGKLPPTLYVQADNCAKDNKNNFVLLFLCQLIKAKIFKKVKLNFLMVGHTHEDIDQMFSRISLKLSKTNTETLPKLHDAIKNGFTPSPRVEHLESIWHLKGQYNGQKKVVGLKSPHVFRFLAGDNDTVELSVKDWPLKDEQYRTLILHDIPDINGTIEVLPPKVDKMASIVHALKADLKKYNDAGRLSEEDVIWWRDYLDRIMVARASNPAIPLPSSIPKCTVPERRNQDSNIESSLRRAINAQIEKLQSVSELTLGNQRIKL